MTDMSEEDKLLISRIGDMVKLAEKRGAVWSSFLNMRECAVAEAELKRLMQENYCFYGIFTNAERKILCVYKEYFCPEDSDFPVTNLTFSYRKENKLSHRDFLGALMALQIKREYVGDIVVGDGIAQIAVCNSIKDVILSDIQKIGSVGVRVSGDSGIILEKQQLFKEIKGTVASMRLDGILSFALNKSRGKTADLISGVGAEVNFSLKTDCSYQLKQGDIFSVKGHGKFMLDEVSGITKKGRIHIKVLKYC